MTAPARVLVVGTGAMGSLFAARLARSGAALVTLAGSWREALDTVAARGITVEEDGGVWRAHVTTSLLAGTLAPADFSLVLVKSHRTASVAPAAAAALAPGGLVATLQNGLGNREILESAAGPGRVAVGAVTLGATLVGAGHVRAVPGQVVLGADPPPVERLASLFRLAGIETATSPAIDRILWRKLAVNCAINPLTGLLRVPNGGLLESPEARETLVRAAREVGAVAAACGIDLAADPAELALDVARRTATNRSSMLQDLDRGAPTEIDAMCGAVVREGARLGVPTPVNESLWRSLQQIETAHPAALARP